MKSLSSGGADPDLQLVISARDENAGNVGNVLFGQSVLIGEAPIRFERA